MFISLSAISGLCVSNSIEVNAQLLNDRDNDRIEDNSDLCPDDPQNSCDGSTPQSPRSMPRWNIRY